GRLVDAGARAGDVVAVHLPRGALSVVVHLGVAKIGAVVAPLGIEDPMGRTTQIVRDSRASVVVTSSPLDVTVPIVSASDRDLRSRGDEEHSRRLTPDLLPSSPFSLLYTSGSTGRPKGVINTIEGLVNQVEWSR